MTPAQNITRHFRGEWHGNQGAFPTPGHSAADRGTTVKDVPGGDVVFHCHNDAGFDWRGMKDECRRLGLLPDRAQANDNCRTDRTLCARDVNAWEYTDADGTVLYRKVRTALPNGGKSYRFEHPDGRGGWLPKRGDADQVPYRLPDILAAEHATVLYMAEGEKQADKLASWGFLATSSKDWRGFDFSGYVKGRTVVILPDNDDEGTRIAEAARKAVETAGGRAVILTLPDLPPKGDIIDWPGSASDLRALTDRALTPPAATFPIADLASWSRTTATPTPFYMAGHIPENEVTLLTGTGGGNKSTFGQQLATCSAAGLQMLGVDVRQGPALYVTAEDNDDRLHWMQEHICRALGVSMAGLSGKLFLTSIRGRLNNELATFDADGRIQPREAFNLLRSTIEATGARLLVLDNVAHLFAGNENDRGHVTAFVNLLYVLCRELGVTVLLIAHKNKAGDTYSGSTAWLNAVRSQLVIERPEGHDPDARVLTIGKANYARPDQQLAFRWHDFALMRDDDLPADQRAELGKVIQANLDDDLFLRCLAKATEDRRAVSHNKGVNYAPAVFASMPEAKGNKALVFAQAFERLLHTGKIRLDQPLWKGSNRVMKQGIKLASDCTHPPAPTPCTNPHQPPSQVVDIACTDPCARTPLYINISGAAPSGSAAPSHEGEVGEGLTASFLADRDPADDIAADWS